jgi:23S rRNA (adenine2503-C2)-methyltransferase
MVLTVADTNTATGVATTTDARWDLLGLTADQAAQAMALILPRAVPATRAVYRGAVAQGVLPATGDTVVDAAWATHARVGLLRVVRLVDETATGTAKAILGTDDGFEVEVVRIPMRYDADGRPTDWTLCISSQVGCKMGCTFCETGRMGLVRQLTAAEIVGEVVTARVTLGWVVRNIVFMGMGEALDNADQVFQAIRVLTAKPGLQYSFERLTICTAGHAEGLARLRAQGWKRLNLSVSLNAATDEARARIMPVNRRTPLAALQAMLAAYPQRRNFCLGVNYCLMPGLNDDPEDPARIAAFCRPLGRVLINLIPYNPGNAPLTRAPTEAEITAFIDGLRAAGLPVRRRLTKGRSIMAACGQLGNADLRRRPAVSAAGRPDPG